MKCYFLRHGIAEENSSSGRDFDRVLTREGTRRMEREAKTIAKLDLQLDLIVASPLLRAKQTADIVESELNVKSGVVEDARVGASFDLENFAQMTGEHSDLEAVMFVGHEPGMSTVIGAVTGGTSIEFKKGSLALVNVPSPRTPHGQLVWLLPAKFLVL